MGMFSSFFSAPAPQEGREGRENLGGTEQAIPASPNQDLSNTEVAGVDIHRQIARIQSQLEKIKAGDDSENLDAKSLQLQLDNLLNQVGGPLQ